MPKGVGLPFAAGTQLVLNMHFINTGTSTLYPKVKLNILRAKDIQYKAAVMVSFNRSINVPAATASGPGMQTVSGTCTAPVGSKFFSMSTHTHKHATAAVGELRQRRSRPQEIVHTGEASTYPAPQQPGTGTDWEHPGVSLWDGPDFLTVQAGRLVHLQLQLRQHRLDGRDRRRDGGVERDVHGDRLLLSGGHRDLQLSLASRASPARVLAGRGADP